MRFEPNDDQASFLSFVEQMSASQDSNWNVAPHGARFEWSEMLDHDLEDKAFYDCATEPTLGTVAAAAMIARLAKLPVLVECAASAMLRPFVGERLPRPIAVIDGRNMSAARFLPKAASVLDISGDTLRTAVNEDFREIESLFAYPMGLYRPGSLKWKTIDGDCENIRDLWRIAVAAEIAGALEGGMEAVLDHVRHRKQFERPLGSFQTVQHRLAAASARIEGGYWLVLRAAQSGAGVDAAAALGYVQQVSTGIVYDLHQFMGAMGITLEHPLHRWTYRVRLLRSTFGGAAENLALAAGRQWKAA